MRSAKRARERIGRQALGRAPFDHRVEQIERSRDRDVRERRLGAHLRQAFTAEHALQCGYCTPGMIMAAVEMVWRKGNELGVQVVVVGNGDADLEDELLGREGE